MDLHPTPHQLLLHVGFVTTSVMLETTILLQNVMWKLEMRSFNFFIINSYDQSGWCCDVMVFDVGFYNVMFC